MLTSARATRPRRSATAAGSSVGSSGRTLPWSGEGAVSAAMRRPLIRVAINTFLERLDADALHDVDEALGVAVALPQIALDQALDHVGALGARERRPDDLAEGCAKRGGPARRRLPHLSLVAADLDLVPLLAVLVDAEDADVADVVVAAGVHAARDVEVELADIVLVVEIVEAPLQRLGDRDRLGVGERAEVAAGAGGGVGDQPEVRRRPAERWRLAP